MMQEQNYVRIQEAAAEEMIEEKGLSKTMLGTSTAGQEVGIQEKAQAICCPRKGSRKPNGRNVIVSKKRRDDEVSHPVRESKRSVEARMSVPFE